MNKCENRKICHNSDEINYLLNIFRFKKLFKETEENGQLSVSNVGNIST